MGTEPFLKERRVESVRTPQLRRQDDTSLTGLPLYRTVHIYKYSVQYKAVHSIYSRVNLLPIQSGVLTYGLPLSMWKTTSRCFHLQFCIFINVCVCVCVCEY